MYGIRYNTVNNSSTIWGVDKRKKKGGVGGEAADPLINQPLKYPPVAWVWSW